MPQIKVGDYLFRRVHELGVQSIFGVPGDYELALLDLVSSNGLEWKGNPNELIASYAADGYARIKGVGAFVTTFGPGELSAYCGMAGHYCEYVPVVHIVGYPGVSAQKAGAIMHHSLGDGRFDMYEAMSKHITVATTVLKDPETAASEIDRVLTSMMHESRPVYIGVPTDIAYALISDDHLKVPLPVSLAEDDRSVSEKVAAEIKTRLENASKPIIIVDGGAVRNGALDEASEISSLTSLPTFVTSMGKGGVNEDIHNFGGVYNGAGSHPEIKTAVETADAVLWIGRYASDFNTAEFTMNVSETKVIDLQRFFLTIGGEKRNAQMKHVLRAFIDNIKQAPLQGAAKATVTWDPYPMRNPPATGKLTQDFLWSTLGRFLRPGDLVIGETGTSAFGLGDTKLPHTAFMYNQTVFGSIGYATGAAVGSFTAALETGKFKRGILVTGEGSLQLTVQAFADLLKLGLKPVVFVLNNGGYTVERLIHGKTALYNDVPLWDYAGLAKVFGPGFPSKYFGPIKTAAQLAQLVDGQELADADCFRLVELVLEPLDAPNSVRLTGAAIDEFNKAKNA